MTIETSLYAAMDGDLAEMKRLLEKNPSLIAARDEFGRTTLHYAAIEGQIEIVALLLLHGAEIDVRDNWDMTPLYLCIGEEPLVEDHLPIASFLIANVADCDSKTDLGSTPLHRAAYGETEIAALLLENGADINAQDSAGDTPLHNAVQYPEVETVRMLLSQPGVKPDLKNNLGLTPLDIAVEKGWTKLITLLRHV